MTRGSGLVITRVLRFLIGAILRLFVYGRSAVTSTKTTLVRYTAIDRLCAVYSKKVGKVVKKVEVCLKLMRKGLNER